MKHIKNFKMFESTQDDDCKWIYIIYKKSSESDFITDTSM